MSPEKAWIEKCLCGQGAVCNKARLQIYTRQVKPASVKNVEIFISIALTYYTFARISLLTEYEREIL
jgi:hypothetical protein